MVYVDDVEQGDLLGITSDLALTNVLLIASAMSLQFFFLLISQFTTAPKGSVEVLSSVLTCKNDKRSLAFSNFF